MVRKRIPPFVWIALIATVLLSAISIHKRTDVEAENKSVAIAVEFETLESLAAGQGKKIDSAFADSKAQGLRAVVLSEETVGELINTGRVMLIGQTPGPTTYGFLLKFQDLSMIPRVQRGLKIRFGDIAGSLTSNGPYLRVPEVSAQLLRSTPIGLSPRQVQLVQGAGLEIIARCSNTGGESGRAIAQTLEWAKEDGARVFLPQGDEVLGFREAVFETLDDLRADGLLYATPEFAKIAGDEKMVEKGKDIVIRLHTAQTAELDKLTPVEAVERYVKAARERGMRILLLRPLSVASDQPYTSFNQFILDIAKGLEANRQVLGAPHPSREPGIPKIFFPLFGLAIVPIVWFVASRFVTSPRARSVGAVLLVIAALASYVRIGQELIALLGSISFPVLGFLILDTVLPKLKGSELKKVFVGFWIVSLVSLVGGLCVAGMLNNLAFYIRAAEFQAVKVSVFLPIIVVGVHYFIKLTDWRGAMKSPMTWGGTALGLGVGLILAVMIARTGNDTGAGPSGGEILFRNFLDRVLYVRPRTKEFLIGHPILVLGIAMLSRMKGALSGESRTVASSSSKDGWTVLALMVGAIGQTSIVNTLCHIHIPFFLSLARDLEGLVLGCIIGVGVLAAIGRWLPEGD